MNEPVFKLEATIRGYTPRENGGYSLGDVVAEFELTGDEFELFELLRALVAAYLADHNYDVRKRGDE